MNKDLWGDIYKIPEDVLNHIKKYSATYPNEAKKFMRSQNLLSTGTVNYNQLKRILHDFKYLDKETENIQYNLYGGELMEKWGINKLEIERKSSQNAKESEAMANEMGGINGMRSNPHNKTHTKKDNYNIPTNIMKSNSDKTSVSPILPVKLFEQIKRIKKLMT